MKVRGKTTICMVRVLTLGVMVESMKESITWTKNMVMGYISGLMGVGTKDIGKMVNSMEKESTLCTMVTLK